MHIGQYLSSFPSMLCLLILYISHLFSSIVISSYFPLLLRLILFNMVSVGVNAPRVPPPTHSADEKKCPRNALNMESPLFLALSRCGGNAICESYHANRR